MVGMLAIREGEEGGGGGVGCYLLLCKRVLITLVLIGIAGTSHEMSF